MLVRYKGHRLEYRDAIYGTGIWISEQIKEVPDAVAHKMTMHADVYSEVNSGVDGEDGLIGNVPATKNNLFCMAAWPESKGVIVVDEKEKPSENDSDQNAVDAVQAMDSKDALADYAKINFGQTVPKTMTVENMKQRIITMIGQYGAQ